MNYTECAKYLTENNRYLVLTHNNPDGDTAGSAAALCSALQRAGKTAYLYPNQGFNDRLKGYIAKFIAPEGYMPERVIAVDIAEKALFPQGFEEDADLCIDHHPSNKAFAARTLLDAKRAACGEIVLKLLKTMKLKPNAEEATLLYIAISTDTGCFRYTNTGAETFSAAAELLKAGADSERVNLEFFRKVSAAKMKLEGLIYSGMRFYRDGEVAVAVVTKEMIAESGAGDEDMDDIAGLAARADKAKICITVREKDKNISRVSVRTSAGISASKICEVFGGGGHTVAAGCTIEAEPERAVRMLMEVIDEVCK